MKKLFSLLLIAAVAVSCSNKLSPDSNWGNTRWVLTEMKGVPVQLSGGTRDAHIEFAPNEKRFSGNGGCNRITGNYTLENKSLRFSDVASTKMSCPDISFETTFLSVLGQVNRYDNEGNSLYLKDGNKVILIFQRR